MNILGLLGACLLSSVSAFGLPNRNSTIVTTPDEVGVLGNSLRSTYSFDYSVIGESYLQTYLDNGGKLVNYFAFDNNDFDYDSFGYGSGINVWYGNTLNFTTLIENKDFVNYPRFIVIEMWIKQSGFYDLYRFYVQRGETTQKNFFCLYDDNFSTFSGISYFYIYNSHAISSVGDYIDFGFYLTPNSNNYLLSNRQTIQTNYSYTSRVFSNDFYLSSYMYDVLEYSGFEEMVFLNCCSYYRFSSLDFSATNTIAVDYYSWSSDNESSYNEGYANGYNDGFNQGEQEGYLHGVAVGEQNGQDTGYELGYDEGYAVGHQAGYNEGVNATHQYTFWSLFGAIADTPVLIIRNLFDFDFFGVNLMTVVLSLFTALIVFYLIRKLL